MHKRNYLNKPSAVVWKLVSYRGLNVVVGFRVPLQTVTILKFSITFHFFLKPNKKTAVFPAQLAKISKTFQNFAALFLSDFFVCISVCLCLCVFVCLANACAYVP